MRGQSLQKGGLLRQTLSLQHRVTPTSGHYSVLFCFVLDNLCSVSICLYIGRFLGICSISLYFPLAPFPVGCARSVLWTAPISFGCALFCSVVRFIPILRGLTPYTHRRWTPCRKSLAWWMAVGGVSVRCPRSLSSLPSN